MFNKCSLSIDLFCLNEMYVYLEIWFRQIKVHLTFFLLND